MSGNEQQAPAITQLRLRTHPHQQGMTFQGVVQSLPQSNQPGEITHIKPEATLDIPIGAALPQKNPRKSTLWRICRFIYNIISS